jgi:L-fuconolactonase
MDWAKPVKTWKPMQRIDAHQHFWNYDPVRDSWITEEMSVIRRDFGPADLEPLLKEQGFNGCVVVQSDQSDKENRFQLANAEQHDFIRGIVGWVDFEVSDLEAQLEQWKQFPKLKGFRHILQGDPVRDRMLTPAFTRGIGLLQKYGYMQKYGYTYDILIFPDQLPFVPTLVAAFPDMRFVIDHLAKPYIRKAEIEPWRTGIRELGRFPNLSVKISGLVTEADWKQWKKEDFKPYIDTVVEAFGTDRLLFGSDWPVCLVAAPYGAVAFLVNDYFSSFSAAEQDRIFGGNAIQFYKL